MPVISSWLVQGPARTWWESERHESRQADVSEEVRDDSTSITLIRAGVAQAAQTVRILTWTPGTGGDERASEGGHEGEGRLTVLGEHTLNIQREDLFMLGTQRYRVIYVAPEQPSAGERKEAGAVQVQ